MRLLVSFLVLASLLVMPAIAEDARLAPGITAGELHDRREAGAALQAAGYEKVLHLEGGLAAWKEAGFPIDGGR